LRNIEGFGRMGMHMQMLTIAEAAKLTERHPDTIRRLIKRLLKEDDRAQDNIKQELVGGGFSYHISSDYLLEHIKVPSATVEMPMQQPRHTDAHTKFADGQHTPQNISDRSDQPHGSRHADTQAYPLQSQHADVQLLRETIDLLKEQLTVKDKQIEQLLERGRETNILLKGYQERYLLEAPNGRKEEEEIEEKTIVVKPNRKQSQKNRVQKSEPPKRKGFFSFFKGK
jgi:hypothetical protein